jgi:transcription initiation factor TFIIB
MIVSSDVEKVEAKTEFKEEETCPDCGGTTILFDPTRGEYICASCGLVIEEHIIDTGPEWRAFTREEIEKRVRVGPPISDRYDDRDLSTEISKPGKKFSPSQRAKMYKLRKRDYRYKHSRPSLRYGLSRVSRIVSQGEFPDNIKKEASRLYRKALEKGLTKGHSIDAMAAAAVYLACRLQKTPIPLDEIITLSGQSRKEVRECIRVSIRKIKQCFPRPTAEDFIPRYAAELDLSIKVQTKAIEIIKKYRKTKGTAGKDPSGLAAAALYIAGILEDEKRNQEEIARVAHVSQVTVRNRYKEMCRKLGIKLI